MRGSVKTSNQTAGQAAARVMRTTSALVLPLMLVLSACGAQQMKVQASTDRASLYESAGSVMTRKDRSVWFAEMCARERGAQIATVEKSKPGRSLLRTDPQSIVDGYGIVRRDGIEESAPLGPLNDEAKDRGRVESLRAKGFEECVTKNSKEQQALALTQAYSSVIKKISIAIQSDAAFKAAMAEWRKCLTAQGYVFRDRVDIVTTLTAERDAIGYVAVDVRDDERLNRMVATLGERELGIARADASCQERFVGGAEAEAAAVALRSLSTSDVAVLESAARLGA